MEDCFSERGEVLGGVKAVPEGGDGDLEGYNIVCPRHGGEFDVRTGKAVQLPVVVDIAAYPVRVTEGMIQVGIPKE